MGAKEMVPVDNDQSVMDKSSCEAGKNFAQFGKKIHHIPKKVVELVLGICLKPISVFLSLRI